MNNNDEQHSEYIPVFLIIFASSENQILHLLERILQKSCTVYEVNVPTL